MQRISTKAINETIHVVSDEPVTDKCIKRPSDPLFL